MKNIFGIDPDQEIVITSRNIMECIHGLVRFSDIMAEIQEKKLLPEKIDQELLITEISILICLVEMFPKENQKKIFKEMKKELGIDAEAIINARR